ncbi:MAG: Lrp/AsnC family transcriptional regulator [Methanomassiliicoccales archaeon]|nr:Lrp/AsnC family transcriptional regulator [Methanomassiliicoccales archaeon]
MVIVDEMNRKILRLLATNGKMTYNEIASTLRRSPSTIRDRIRRLEDEKIILGYVAVVNTEQTGMKSDAILLANPAEGIGREQLKKLKEVPGVMEVLSVSGNRLLLIRVHAQDNRALEDMIANKLIPIGLKDVEVQIVLESVMRFPGI